MSAAEGAVPSLVLAGVLIAAGVAPAQGQSGEILQNYPNKPIRLIIPQSPGGPSDIIARLTGQKLGENLGHAIVLDNRSGAGGSVGCEIASKAAPDGYTLLLGPPGCLTVNPSLYGKLPYDPLRDFEPITQLTSGPQMLAVHPSVAAHSVKELVALAKVKPGQFNYASGGAGSLNHLAFELFKMVAHLQIVHIPYKGTGPASAALVGGQVQMMMVSLPPGLPHVKAGRLRSLAVTSAQRTRAAPELPTVAESGFPGFETVSWHSLLAPAKTPKAIITRLHGELVKTLAQTDVKERFASLGLDAVGGTPEELTQQIKRETARWAKVIKETGIKAD